VAGETSVEVGASVLDACCGTRSMWFDRADGRALFLDNRRESLAVDVGTPGTIGRSPIVIAPDIVGDFTALPFADESFSLVVFDPPHVQRNEALGAVTRRYGVLNGDWRQMLREGFAECLRVLKPNGVLVFKWGESQFRVAEILALAPVRPLFGHHTSKTTYWAVFMKGAGSLPADLGYGTHPAPSENEKRGAHHRTDEVVAK
jgi:SAM-dependent methyltransferase